MPSSTVENYLKAISRLAEENFPDGLVPVGKIAEHLGLAAGTATAMMKHLEREGFAHYSPRKGVTLTEAGHKEAAQVLRRHRLIELFLVKVMKLDWSEVHEEAEILEHAFSRRLIERIDEMLGHPGHDPHGDPIPDASGTLRSESLRMLKDCQPGTYRLIRVSRHQPDFLTWLQTHGLIPGSRFSLKSNDQLAGLLLLQIENQQETVQIGEAMATSLWVA